MLSCVLIAILASPHGRVKFNAPVPMSVPDHASLGVDDISAIINDGLFAGDMVVTTPLGNVISGTAVRIIEPETPVDMLGDDAVSKVTP